MTAAQGEKRRRGRPAGGREGQRVRDFPALLVRLPPEIHEILSAVAEVKNWSRARAVIEAIVTYNLNYLRDHEPSVSRRVEELLASRRNAAKSNASVQPSKP
jgi:hypothetical protein